MSNSVSNSQSILETLHAILAPAGGGVHVLSTGLAETQALQQAIYSASGIEEITERWHATLENITKSKVVLLGVPSDTGAGFVRGSNQGPAVIRKELLGNLGHAVHRKTVVDAGDVRVIPHLLSEEMVSEAQLAACRDALYGDATSSLPVTPLDQCSLALDCIRQLNPDIVPIVLGGDHSIGWPAFSSAFAWAKQHKRHVGLLHFDAHTDLLEKRLGVRYCFATWAYHANELLERDGRLVQVGIRASGKTRQYWEKTLGVRQYWPEEYLGKPIARIASDIISRFRERGVDCLYLSNDIDGTDSEFAAATGTPEGRGLHPDQVSELTLQITKEFPLIGADLVEVAPPLGGHGEPAATLTTACRYLSDMIQAAEGHSLT